jgi:hypothetical protein
MMRLLLNRFRGQYQNPVVIKRIRRTIAGSVVSHRTVLVDMEGSGITEKEAAAIMVGWDTTTVKFCGSLHSLPAALPENAMTTASSPRHSRRNLRAKRGQNAGGKTP